MNSLEIRMDADHKLVGDNELEELASEIIANGWGPKIISIPVIQEPGDSQGICKEMSACLNIASQQSEIVNLTDTPRHLSMLISGIHEKLTSHMHKKNQINSATIEIFTESSTTARKRGGIFEYEGSLLLPVRLSELSTELKLRKAIPALLVYFVRSTRPLNPQSMFPLSQWSLGPA